MKTKLVYALFFVSLFFGCSDDTINVSSEELKTKNDPTFAERISSKDFDHVMYYSNFDAGIKNGVVSLFKNDSLYGELTYTGDLGYEVVEYSDRVRIINEIDTNEYFDIYNVTDLNGKLIFDVKTVEGTILNDVEYSFEGNRLPCPWCWVVGAVVSVVKVIADATNETECQTAITACVAAGGLPSTTITTGLFSSSCSVTCNQQ